MMPWNPNAGQQIRHRLTLLSNAVTPFSIKAGGVFKNILKHTKNQK